MAEGTKGPQSRRKIRDAIKVVARDHPRLDSCAERLSSAAEGNYVDATRFVRILLHQIRKAYCPNVWTKEALAENAPERPHHSLSGVRIASSGGRNKTVIRSLIRGDSEDHDIAPKTIRVIIVNWVVQDISVFV